MSNFFVFFLTNEANTLSTAYLVTDISFKVPQTCTCPAPYLYT